MGQNHSGLPGQDKGKDDKAKEKKRFEPPPPPTRVGKKQKRKAGDASSRLPTVTPNSKCKLRLLKLERVKDYLLIEEEYVANQERLKPAEDRTIEDRSKVLPRKMKPKTACAACLNLYGAAADAYGRGVCAVLHAEHSRAPTSTMSCSAQVDDLRGSPMSVGTLEEIVDDKCAPFRAPATQPRASHLIS